MSVGQLASGILGAICYSGTQSLSAIVLNTRVWKAGGGYVCSVGFKWVSSTWGVLCQMLYFVNRSIRYGALLTLSVI